MAALLGLDLGEKRVGVAVSDEMGSLAVPLKTLSFISRKELLREIQSLVREYAVESIVVGFPITLKGETGPAAKKVQEHVRWFEEKLPMPWILWDERLTTQEVERILLDADLSRDRRKEVRDRLAAQRILQNYLDFKRMKGENRPL